MYVTCGVNVKKLFTNVFDWLIIVRKSLLCTILLKDFTDFSTQQYCHVGFPLQFFDKRVKNGTFRKILACM